MNHCDEREKHQREDTNIYRERDARGEFGCGFGCWLDENLLIRRHLNGITRGGEWRERETRERGREVREARK